MKINEKYYLSLSLIFFIQLIIINFFYSSSNIMNDIDRIIFSTLFIIINFFGLSLSFYPKWYTKIIGNKFNLKRNKSINNDIGRIGHHPDCREFKNHVFKLGEKNYCSGCFGLGIGSIISITIFLIYFFVFGNFYLNIFFYTFFLGGILVLLSFIEIIINTHYSIIHIISNIFLPVGFLLIIISTYENSGNLIFGFISILASFLFLETRIQLSINKHTSICMNCQNNCKMY